MRRSFSRRHRGGTRRKRAWGGFETGGTFTSFDSGFTGEGDTTATLGWARFPAGIISPDDENVVPTDLTVVRTLCSGAQRVQTALSADEWGNYAFGFGILSWDNVDDTTPDITQVPTPTLDPQADWIVHQVICAAMSPIFANETQTVNFGTLNGDFDFRSKRKLSEYTGLLFVVSVTILEQSTAAIPFTQWGFAHRARQLFLLP